jgi:hypothetical protein
MPTTRRIDMRESAAGWVAWDPAREATARWAEYRCVEIAAWLVGEDESGGTPGSAWSAGDDPVRQETAGIACCGSTVSLGAALEAENFLLEGASGGPQTSDSLFSYRAMFANCGD